MNSKRAFYLMIGIVALLGCLMIGSVVIGNSILQKQAAKLDDLKLQNRVLDEEQTSLGQANKDIQKYADLEKIAKTIVPQDKDQAEAVRQIVSLANTNNITLKAISFPTSTLGQSTVIPKTATGSTPQITKTPSLTQVKPVEGIPGVYSMDIIVQSDDTTPAPYRNFLNFLQGLENNRRTAQVTNITIQPSNTKPDALSFTVTLSLYIKP